jgi:hypothetical protein
VRLVVLSLVIARTAAADPSLDDFYERTRDRDVGFGDSDRILAIVAGAQTANPSTDALMPHLASGIRLGVAAGVRRERDVVKTELWADVLRVHETGDWFTDLGWHTTAFRAWDVLHLSADALVARRSEIQPSDVAELQLDPYETVDVEAEAAPIGPRIDKDAHLAFPIGVANRLRWDDAGMSRKTTVSAAVAARGFPKDIRHHAQLDVLRVKRTDWDGVAAWTLSAGYQRLPMGIDTLPIWALVGYEWAGDRSGAVWQVGGAYERPNLSIGPSIERHFELDPRTGDFARVDSAKLAYRQRMGPVLWGLALEAVSIEDRGSLRALTPEAGVAIHGVELVARYRLAWTHDLMFPADRFTVGLDWLL